MATGEEIDMDEFKTAEPTDQDDDATWLDLTDETPDDPEQVVGELREIKQNCGEFNSRVYRLSRGPGDDVLLWGCASIDRQIDQLQAGPGDVIALQFAGYYETDNGQGTEFRVGIKE